MVGQNAILNVTTSRYLRQLAVLFAMLMSGGNPIFPRIPLLLLILALCLACKGITFGIRRQMGLIGVVLLGVFIIAVVGVEGVDLVAVATRYANFIVGVALLGLYLDEPRNTLSLDMQPIFRFMVFQIIGTVVLAIVLPQAFVVKPVNDVTYYTIFWVFTYHVTVLSQALLVRPDGFFWEPGVFQIYMNIYLFISLFVVRRRYDVPLAVIGVLLLQSTTGLLIAMMLIGVAGLQRFNQTGNSGKALVLVIAPLIVAPLIFIAVENFTTKTSGTLRGSSWARAYDFYTGVNIIAAHPIRGIGFDYERYRVEANRLGYGEGPLDYKSTADRSNSNGLIMLLASIGIPMSLPFLIGLFRQRFFPKPWLFGGLLTLSFVGEAVMLTPFFLMIMFSAMLIQRRRETRRRPEASEHGQVIVRDRPQPAHPRRAR